jgi:hypothetical protein
MGDDLRGSKVNRFEYGTFLTSGLRDNIANSHGLWSIAPIALLKDLGTCWAETSAGRPGFSAYARIASGGRKNWIALHCREGICWTMPRAEEIVKAVTAKRKY